MKWPHKEQELITVGGILEMQARHTMHHIGEILAIRQTHGF